MHDSYAEAPHFLLDQVGAERTRFQKRHRILLAEDDAEMRSTLSSVLRDAGCDVTEAEDGDALAGALDKMAFATLSGDPDGATPDLIISDINMPGWSGLEVLTLLRKGQWETPVILMTGYGDTLVRDQAQRLGVEVLLKKPFPLRELLDAVFAVNARRGALAASSRGAL